MTQPVQTRSIPGGGKTVTAGAILLLMAVEAFMPMPYRDIAGVWTDGYGNTENVVPGVAVSEPQARAKLMEHVNYFGQGVLKCLSREPTQGQYDAFVLMAYNTGLGARGKVDGFCYLKNGNNSTLVRRFNAGDDLGACLAMLSWVKVKGQFSKGVYNRRWKEYQLCVAGSPGGVR